MYKRVLVVASGDTERSALPSLLAFLGADGIEIEVRRSHRSGRLNVEIASEIIRASWFQLLGGPKQPDKFVVLVDADGRPSEVTLAQMSGLREACFRCPTRLG